MRHRAFFAAVPLATAFLFTAASASAQTQQQTATTISTPETPLLPQSFGAWQQTTTTDSQTPAFSLTHVSKDALEECSPQRSKTADYANNGRTMHVEAVEFNDATGAFSAFTLSELPQLKQSTELGSHTAIGLGGVLFTSGSILVLANPATAADLPALKQLEATLPKIGGPRSQPPLLPALVPSKGLEQGSVRYLLGANSYAMVGGSLPNSSLGWDKSAEVVTAKYADKRGKETLTLLLYPTPQIAGDHTRQLEALTKQLHTVAVPPPPGSDAKPVEAQLNQPVAKVRREGELVVLAQGSFSPDDALNLVENIHLRQEVSFNKELPLSFPTELHKTYSLLQSIVIFSGVGALAAILLGLFLGFGRAAIRRMRGLDAATEAEFLSLHLDPQNAHAKLEPPA